MQEKYKANMANMLKGAMQYQNAATSRQVLTTLHIYLYSNACTDTYIVQALHTTVTVSTAYGIIRQLTNELQHLHHNTNPSKGTENTVLQG